jgi:hypothetical protein
VLQATTGADFVSQVSRVIDDHMLRTALGSRARAHVEKHFSFVAIGAELAQFYSTLDGTWKE